MSRTRTIDVGWAAPDTDDDMIVTMEYEPGSPGGREEPPCGPEISVLEIREDREGGALRPDLLDAANKWLAGRGYDVVCDRIADEDADRYAAAMEDRADSARDAIWDTVRAFAGKKPCPF